MHRHGLFSVSDAVLTDWDSQLEVVMRQTGIEPSYAFQEPHFHV